MSERGPIYDVELIDALPINYGTEGGILQAMPSRPDLQNVKDCGYGSRMAAGYEILLNTWRMQGQELADIQATLDHHVRACQRGIELWQAAGEGRELKHPSTDRLVAFLLEELDRAKGGAK